MVNEESENGRRGYQIVKITCTKSGDTLNAYMCAQGGIWEELKDRS